MTNRTSTQTDVRTDTRPNGRPNDRNTTERTFERPKYDRSDPARTAFAKSPAADGGGTKVILGDSGGILQQEFLFGNKTEFPKSLLRQTSPWDD